MPKQPSKENKDISNVVAEKAEDISVKGDKIKSVDLFNEFPGIPVVPSNQSKKPGVIFVFEKASLVPALVGKTYQILNAEDHAGYLRRKKLDPYIYRPDIIFEALLELTDSNLYREGGVDAIYVKTDQGVLIKIEPNTCLPRTFGSFCSMMCCSPFFFSKEGSSPCNTDVIVSAFDTVSVTEKISIYDREISKKVSIKKVGGPYPKEFLSQGPDLQLLQKLSTNAKGKRAKLLRLVKNPVTQHLPANSLKIGLSFSSQKLVQVKDYVGAISNDVNLVFVVGAMAHGKIDCEYVDDFISVSEYPLSAVCCLRRIYRALERKKNIG